MKTKNNNIYLLLWLTLFWVGLAIAASDLESMNEMYTSFQTKIENEDEVSALELGGQIFQKLEGKYRTHAGFNALKSKLTASEFLSNQMIQQLQKATSAQMQMITGQLLNKEEDPKKKKQEKMSLAPAKTFYDTSIETFRKPIDISAITDQEIQFLKRYYNLRLCEYTTNISKAGQALTIARPDFKDTHHYVLVLPLLHFPEPQSIPLDVLPKWMRKSERLIEFSDSCLLHYGLCYQAKEFVQKASEMNNQSFSEYDFYQSAAERCKMISPNVAVDCLKHSCELVKDNPKKHIPVLYSIIQIWMDAGNYELASAEARMLISKYESYPESIEAGWLYFYALSRSNNAQTILNEIDSAIQNPKYEQYKPKFMYLKWWALRRQRDQMERVTALEHELLKLYGNDPMVAPIMLSRATDLLASQDYNGAYELLNQLCEKFPDTKASEQAKKILQKLTAIVNRG